jgi:predicted nucleic acid-binding protein
MLAALLSSRGASRQLLLDGLARRFEWLCSVPLLLEYEAVLKRPEYLFRAGLEADDIDTLLDSVAAVIVPVRFSFLWRPSLKDPKDEMVLETAANGRADWVATMDLHHLENALKLFGIRAMPPGAAIRVVRNGAL